MITIKSKIKEDYSYITEKLQELFAMHQGFRSEYSVPKEAEIQKELIEDSIGFVAYANSEERVGFVRGRMSPRKKFDEPSSAALLDMFVEKYFRKKGVGSDLLEAFSKEVKKHDIDILRLQVDVKNEMAQKFWKDKGFEPLQLKMSKKI